MTIIEVMIMIITENTENTIIEITATDMEMVMEMETDEIEINHLFV